MLNTWSELTPCNAHLNGLDQRVKYGVHKVADVPKKMPSFSARDSGFQPTSVMLRNLAVMKEEGAMRGYPMIGRAHKTTLSLLTAAASNDLLSSSATGGPLLIDDHRGERVGPGTDLWKCSEAVTAGEMTQEEIAKASMLQEASMLQSPLAWDTICIASTIASMAEESDMAQSSSGAILRKDNRCLGMVRVTGRRSAQVLKDDLKPSINLTKPGLENTPRTDAAKGDLTSAVIQWNP